jgi:hypothetical protein
VDPSDQAVFTPFDVTALDRWGSTAASYTGDQIMIFSGPTGVSAAPVYPATLTATEGMITCSRQSRTTWRAGLALSGLSSREHSSPRRSVASSLLRPVDSPTLDAAAAFTCRATGPGPSGGADVSLRRGID